MTCLIVVHKRMRTARSSCCNLISCNIRALSTIVSFAAVIRVVSVTTLITAAKETIITEESHLPSSSSF